MSRGSFRSLCVLSASLVVLAMGPGFVRASQARGRAVPQNVDVTAMPGNEAEDAIAVNPTNPQNVVAMSTLPDVPAGLAVGVSFDGGQTWTREVIGTGGDLGEICCDQQLAWDDFGNLWMVYLLNTNGNVPLAVSTDGGLTFSKVAEIEPTKVKGVKGGNHSGIKRLREEEHRRGEASADQPSISVGPNSVWVSWTSYPQQVVQASGAEVTGLGRFGAFSVPETVPTSAGRGNYGDTSVGPDGQVMVIYQDATNAQGGSHIYTALDPDGFGPAGFDRPRFLARSRVGGFDYIPAQPDRSVDAEANLAWDRTGGRVYAIWTQEVKNESDNTDIMLQSSDDDGTSWSPAVRLNDDDTTNSQFNPAIAVDQASGAVAVSWYDARNDMGQGGAGDSDGAPNTDVQIWAIDSADGGVTFVPNFQVSEGSSSAIAAGSYFDYGDYTHAAFVSGTFYPAWSDNSNSTGDNPDGTLHQFDLLTAAIPIP